MTLIKICGVTQPEDASLAAKEGADFVGIILSTGFPRSVDIEQAKEIVAAVKQHFAEPVGLFTKETSMQMEDIIESLSLKVVQLHTPFALKEGESLTCRRLLVNAFQYPSFKAGDYYLYDKYSGQKEGRAWFLAGGLNPQNVLTAIHEQQPAGVDVSSGVESLKVGVKDKDLLRFFIRAVKYGEG